MEVGYEVAVALLSISLIILAIVLFMFYKRRGVGEVKEPPLLAFTKASPHTYSLSDIDAATDGFSQQRIIGRGRLGTVYAGMFASSSSNSSSGGGGAHDQPSIVAVKRVHPGLVLSNNSSFNFSSSMKSLSVAAHPNIVPILGFSEAPGERIVLMELSGMVNLEFFLHHNTDGVTLLDWDKRLQITAGAARGIRYLHDEISPSIIHGSVKTSNVIIDARFCPKLCDYGLHFLAPNERRGLRGYVDDEFWVKGASKEGDVYAFGVMLLEILSGRMCEEGLLVRWALPLIREMKVNEVLDPRLVAPSNLNPLIRFARVALACVGNSRKHRPSIGQVATILNNLEMVPCR
uniref:Protein kinase domain-containing protein n=1 Tax=Kalanchoe fedtschenkoi TaxID=63787 RepID=A0A7N0R991_KALFE